MIQFGQVNFSIMNRAESKRPLLIASWAAFTGSSTPPYPYIVTGYIWLFPNSRADAAIPDFNVVTKSTTPRTGYNLASTELITDATIFLNSLAGGRRYVNISAAGGTLV